MKLKLFGKELFEFNKDGGYNPSLRFIDEVEEQNKKSKVLPDFSVASNSEYESLVEMVPDGFDKAVKQRKDKKKKEAEFKRLSPRDVFEAKMLNEEGFKININKAYVDEQIKDFTKKLKIIKASEKDFRNGVKEIYSVLIRMRNRKKYPEFKKFFESFAYTTTSKINKVVAKHDHLKLGELEQFIADMPREAVREMESYTKQTKKLCEKSPVFYIIADKKDFKKTHERRDPILLAQSPFGHFWQIIGAWDDTMLFLEEL